MNTSINQVLRLITLWIAWLLAMLFHMDLLRMPLFHPQPPEIHGHVQERVLPLLFGAMLGYFLLTPVTISVLSASPCHGRHWLHYGWRRVSIWFHIRCASVHLKCLAPVSPSALVTNIAFSGPP